MIILGALIYLPKKIIFVISLLILIGHNSLDNLTINANQPFAWLWHLLHQPHGGFSLGKTYIGFYISCSSLGWNYKFRLCSWKIYFQKIKIQIIEKGF